MIFFMDSITLTFSHLFPCPTCHLQVIPQSTLSSLPREKHCQSLILYEILIDQIVVSQAGAKSFSPPWTPLQQNSARHVQFAIIDFVCFKLYGCSEWVLWNDIKPLSYLFILSSHKIHHMIRSQSHSALLCNVSWLPHVAAQRLTYNTCRTFWNYLHKDSMECPTTYTCSPISIYSQ